MILGGNTEEPEESDTKEEEVEVDEIMEETKSILRHFSDYGEIIWFEGYPNLDNSVITQPMQFVRCLRTLISHNVQDKFKGVKLKEQRSIFQILAEPQKRVQMCLFPNSLPEHSSFPPLVHFAAS